MHNKFDINILYYSYALLITDNIECQIAAVEYI